MDLAIELVLLNGFVDNHDMLTGVARCCRSLNSSANTAILFAAANEVDIIYVESSDEDEPVLIFDTDDAARNYAVQHMMWVVWERCEDCGVETYLYAVDDPVWGMQNVCWECGGRPEGADEWQ